MLHTFGFLKFSDEHNVYFKLDSIGICGYTIFKDKAYKLVLVLTVSLELGVPTQKNCSIRAAVHWHDRWSKANNYIQHNIHT